jgi:23S rRNA (pseudouridine1915-N3)-methyltransferase
MRIRLIAVGQRMPDWVQAGYQEFVQRLPRTLQPELIEIPLAVRGKNADIARAKQQEGDKVLKLIPRDAHVVALDERGAAWRSLELAGELKRWLEGGQDLALLIGGPDGHAAEVLQRANQRWSLSPLTLPHAMVRVLIAEQLYRAHSLNSGHPYHRE